jgi:3-methylcrotonyl-CoA carboxylase alpha subunit
VEAHALLVVLEAMKMEHRIEAPLAGIVRDVRVTTGELVASGALLVTIGAA